LAFVLEDIAVREIAIVAVILIGAGLIPGRGYGQDEAFKKYLEDLNREVKSDVDGERGRKAREICNKRLGVNIPADTGRGRDVLRLYGEKKALDWTDCTAKEMHY
jgi:hypothetical protein